MELEAFRSSQPQLRTRYGKDAKSAFLTLKASGEASSSTVTCKVETGRGVAVAGIRGTLGITDGVQVGFTEIRLRFDVDTDAPKDKRDELLKLVERYCVVFQTIQNSPKTDVQLNVRQPA